MGRRWKNSPDQRPFLGSNFLSLKSTVNPLSHNLFNEYRTPFSQPRMLNIIAK